MHILARIARHARITRINFERAPSPPFLILFINSTCNQKCDHCFYWRNLNRNDDLTMEEMVSLSRSLGYAMVKVKVIATTIHNEISPSVTVHVRDA